MFAHDDDMIECPYNKSHVMLRKRLQSHLIKCRKQHPDTELRKCPFNSTHLVREPELSLHAINCPDRKLITQYKYDAPEEEKIQHAPIESEENWDDTDVPDYDPHKYAANAAVIRLPTHSTPSERKAFIQQERKRLGDDSDTEDVNEDTAAAIAFFSSQRESYWDNQLNGRPPSPPLPPSISDSKHENTSRRSRSPHEKDERPEVKRNRQNSPESYHRSMHRKSYNDYQYGNNSNDLDTDRYDQHHSGDSKRNFDRANDIDGQRSYSQYMQHHPKASKGNFVGTNNHDSERNYNRYDRQLPTNSKRNWDHANDLDYQRSFDRNGRQHYRTSRNNYDRNNDFKRAYDQYGQHQPGASKGTRDWV